MNLHTILSPVEIPSLEDRDLGRTICVVFDILRATSSFVTALHNGAAGVLPAADIAEAVRIRASNPGFLLAGERDGVRIRAAQSGGVDFDFGNSPREFTPDAVRGRTLISTTTNGTLALRACRRAGHALAASFLNLAATVEWIRARHPSEVQLICAGTGDSVAAEDVLGAGALAVRLLEAGHPPCILSGSAQEARSAFLSSRHRLAEALGQSANGRRLLGASGLRDDVAFCAQVDACSVVARMDSRGMLRDVSKEDAVS